MHARAPMCLRNHRRVAVKRGSGRGAPLENRRAHQSLPRVDALMGEILTPPNGSLWPYLRPPVSLNLVEPSFLSWDPILPNFFAIPKRVIPPRSFGHFCAIFVNKSHEAESSPLSLARDHVDPKRHVGTRYEPPDLRSALRHRYRGLLPRAVRQDPPQPRSGEQNMEGPRLPRRTLSGSTSARSRTRILGRREVISSYACWTTTKHCLYPTRESLDFLVKLRGSTTLLPGGV